MGTGIKRMRDLVREAGLKQPDFTSDKFFHAVFYRNPEYALKQVSETAGEGRQKTTQKIMQAIADDPQITSKALADRIGLTEDGIKYHLNNMQKKHLLCRIGPDKGGHLEIVGKNNSG